MLPTTEGSTTSRVADAITNAGNQSLFNSESGVLYWEGSLNSDANNESISIYSSDDNNKVAINVSTDSLRGFAYSDGTLTGYVQYATIEVTDDNKIAWRWKDDEFSLFLNGEEVGTRDESGNAPLADTLSELAFDWRYNGTDPLMGKTKALGVFEYLSDDQMVKLTGEGYDTFNALATANNFIIR